jgi:multiple sugar transport system permease protein
VTDRRRHLFLLAPYAFGLTALVFLPGLVTFALALTEYDLIRSPSFVGLDNFRELWNDAIFERALRNSLHFAAFGVPFRLVIAFGLALLLHASFRGVTLFRSAAVVPTVVPEIAYGLLWLWFFNPLYGPINLFLDLGGAPERTFWGARLPQWLTNGADARAAIVVMSLFTIGELFVVLLVARQAIPRALYELGETEGASPFRTFATLTLPLLAPVLLLLFCRDTIFSLQATFVPALIVTNGGPPPYETTYVPLFVYRNAFEYLRYGYASAATVVMFVLTGLIVLLQWRIYRRWRMAFSG